MTERESEAGGVSRPAALVATLVGIGLVAWFFFAWLALDRSVVDAAGESVGTGLVLLLVVSVAGMILKRG